MKKKKALQAENMNRLLLEYRMGFLYSSQRGNEGDVIMTNK